MLAPTHLFKDPFWIVLSMALAILGNNNDCELDEDVLALLMMIFMLDDSPPMMFQFSNFLASQIRVYIIILN